MTFEKDLKRLTCHSERQLPSNPTPANLTSPAGTVRALSYHPTAKETLAVAGLDRFLYIYHRHKLLKFKHYIKLATCSLLFSSEPEFNPEDREEANIKGQEQAKPEKQQVTNGSNQSHDCLFVFFLWRVRIARVVNH